MEIGRSRRVYLYISLTLLMALSAAAAASSPWRSSPEFHTNLSLIAAVLAVAMGMGALVRFCARKAPKFLFIGAGFLGTALLDTFHAGIGFHFWPGSGPIPPEDEVSLTWNAAQIFLAAMLLMGAGVHEWKDKESDGRRRFNLRLGIAAVVLSLCWAMAMAPFEKGFTIDPAASHGVGILTALFFLAVLGRYLKKGAWRKDPFDYWLVASLFLCCGAQILFTARPGPLFDAMFDMAHILKIAAYGLVLTGVLSNGYQLFLQTDRQVEALAQLNEKLRRVIAQRERAEAALRVSEERFSLALQGSDEGLWDWPDTSRPAQWWSPRFYSMLGYEPGEIEASRTTFLRRLLEREDHNRVRAAMKAHRDRGEPFDIEYRLRTKTGISRWFRSRANTFRADASGRVRMVGTIIDIHRRKLAEAQIQRQAEELKQVNQELEQFAYAASHDLQEPIRTLIGYCNMLREDLGPDLGEDAARDLHHIVEGANRMKALIQDLLALSRAGRTEPKKDAVDLEECVRQSLENLRQQITETAATIHWENLPVVAGDPTTLTLVYQNLLSNALKFRGPESPDITLTAEAEKERWVLGVRDNGIGLDSQYADRIFSPFQRLHGMAEYAGNGIGLAICRKTVERHGGRIWVESEPGRGAHFKFALPAPQEPMKQS